MVHQMKENQELKKGISDMLEVEKNPKKAFVLWFSSEMLATEDHRSKYLKHQAIWLLQQFQWDDQPPTWMPLLQMVSPQQMGAPLQQMGAPPQQMGAPEEMGHPQQMGPPQQLGPPQHQGGFQQYQQDMQYQQQCAWLIGTTPTGNTPLNEMLANVSFRSQISQPLLSVSHLLHDSQGPSQGRTTCTTSVSPATTSSHTSTPVIRPGILTPVADVMSDVHITIDPQLAQESLDPQTQQEGEERIISVIKKEKKKDEQ